MWINSIIYNNIKTIAIKKVIKVNGLINDSDNHKILTGFPQEMNNINRTCIISTESIN